MVKRQVLEPLVSYRDADGVWRHALQGEQVDVDPDYLDEFDRLNFVNSDTPPRKRGPAVTEPSPDSRRSVKKAEAVKAGRQPTPRSGRPASRHGRRSGSRGLGMWPPGTRKNRCQPL